VFAVNWPPHEPALGHAVALELVEFRVGHLAGRVGADALVHVDDRDVAALELAGQDRAAVEEDRRQVHARHGHQRARQRLVAAGEADERVVAVGVHHQLDRVGDDLARHERRLHPLVAHADAVADGDRHELPRVAAGRQHALAGGKRLAVERRVARRRLVPRRGDADPRLVDVFVGQAHRAEERALRGALRAVGDDRGLGAVHGCRGS
jgi:hypothetical protein